MTFSRSAAGFVREAPFDRPSLEDGLQKRLPAGLELQSLRFHAFVMDHFVYDNSQIQTGRI
jgi:hypothetical protein